MIWKPTFDVIVSDSQE